MNPFDPGMATFLLNAITALIVIGGVFGHIRATNDQRAKDEVASEKRRDEEKEEADLRRREEREEASTRRREEIRAVEIFRHDLQGKFDSLAAEVRVLVGSSPLLVQRIMSVEVEQGSQRTKIHDLANRVAISEGGNDERFTSIQRDVARLTDRVFNSRT